MTVPLTPKAIDLLLVLVEQPGRLLGKETLLKTVWPETSHDIFVLPTSGEGKPFPYLQTPAMENGGAFSPDGNWIAYKSDDSGRSEVYVERFTTHGGKRQISPAGGSGR